MTAINLEIQPYYNRIVEPPAVPKYITDELAAIGGLNPFGEPLLILEWGGSATKWPGGPIKYLDHCEKDGENILRVGVPCWFISKWWPPERLMPAGAAHWQAIRMEVVGGKLYDLTGPVPTRGQYRAEIAWQHPETGDNLPLDNQLLEFVRECKWRRDAEPDESVMDADQQEAALQKAVAREIDVAKENRRKWHERFKDQVRDAIEPLRRQIAQGNRPRQGMDGRWRRGSTYNKQNEPLIIIPE